MKKFEALAVVEIRYYTHALEVLDHMCKATSVEFLCSENTLGGRLVTLIASGSIAEATDAVDAVKELCSHKENNPLKMALVITNPHQEIMKYIVSSKPYGEVEEIKKEITSVEKRERKSKREKVRKHVGDGGGKLGDLKQKNLI